MCRESESCTYNDEIKEYTVDNSKECISENSWCRLAT